MSHLNVPDIMFKITVIVIVLVGVLLGVLSKLDDTFSTIYFCVSLSYLGA